MLYIADLKRNGLIKIGVAGWYRTDWRESELRRRWKAPKLCIVSCTVVPYGWGPETEWERRLISRLKKSAALQLFSGSEKGREIVDCTPKQALEELRQMHRETEIDFLKDADELPDDKVDWRFCNAFLPEHYQIEHDNGGHYWMDLITRQVFINWLRGDARASVPDRILNAKVSGNRGEVP